MPSDSTALQVRPEDADDVAAIARVHRAAFPSEAEALLVDALRAKSALSISLVAERAGEIVGHVAFSPVTLAEAPQIVGGLGLAPLAVLPSHQRAGIGAQLTRTGLERARAAGFAFVVVLGEPDYYARFGFRRASDAGLSCVYPCPPEAFMVLELAPGTLRDLAGLVHYHAAFETFE